MAEFMHVEDQPDRQGSAMVQIQRIVDRIAADHAGGGDPQPLRAMLEEAIAAAGLPEQPQKWVSDTAAEIAAGRTAVVDRRTESLPQLAAPKDDD